MAKGGEFYMSAPLGKRTIFPGARRPTGRPARYKKRSLDCIDKPEQIERCLSCTLPEQYCTGQAYCKHMKLGEA